MNIIEIAKKEYNNQDWVVPLCDYLEETKRGPFIIIIRDGYDEYNYNEYNYSTDIVGCFSTFALALQTGMATIKENVGVEIIEIPIDKNRVIKVGYVGLDNDNKKFFVIHQNYR